MRWQFYAIANPHIFDAMWRNLFHSYTMCVGVGVCVCLYVHVYNIVYKFRVENTKNGYVFHENFTLNPPHDLRFTFVFHIHCQRLPSSFFLYRSYVCSLLNPLPEYITLALVFTLFIPRFNVFNHICRLSIPCNILSNEFETNANLHYKCGVSMRSNKK